MAWQDRGKKIPARASLIFGANRSLLCQALQVAFRCSYCCHALQDEVSDLWDSDCGHRNDNSCCLSRGCCRDQCGGQVFRCDGISSQGGNEGDRNFGIHAPELRRSCGSRVPMLGRRTHCDRDGRAQRRKLHSGAANCASRSGLDLG
jgi:hypothetical protein